MAKLLSELIYLYILVIFFSKKLKISNKHVYMQDDEFKRCIKILKEKKEKSNLILQDLFNLFTNGLFLIVFDEYFYCFQLLYYFTHMFKLLYFFLRWRF